MIEGESMNSEEKSAEEAVLCVSQVTTDERFFSELNRLEGELVRIIEANSCGEYDGHEVGQGELTLYMYGPSAEKLYILVSTTLRASKLTSTSSVTMRFGPPGAPPRIVFLDGIETTSAH